MFILSFWGYYKLVVDICKWMVAVLSMIVIPLVLQRVRLQLSWLQFKTINDQKTEKYNRSLKTENVEKDT